MSALSLALMAAALGAAPAPQFYLHAKGEEVPAGTIERVGADSSITLAGHEPIPGTDVISLRRVGAALPGWPREPQLLLVGGDRIVGEIVDCDGRGLRFRPKSAGGMEGNMRVPLSRVDVLWLAPRPRELCESDPRYAALKGARQRDLLLLRNGDAISGDLLGIDGTTQKTRLQTSRELAIENAKIAAVGFNTQLARARTPKGIYARVVLTDGSRLTLQSASADAKSLTAETDFKAKLTIRWEDIVALDLFGGAAEYLSDLRPKKYDYAPFLSERYPWVADRNVEDGPIQLRTKDGPAHFDKGLGLHSQCKLVYALDGKYRTFEAGVGLDEELGKKGDAEVRILIDGKQGSGSQRRLTHGGELWPVRMDIRNAKELTIEVNWGNGGHVGDAVDLGDARLILGESKR
jgi:NPCBM/NEW2 domain